VDLDNARLVLEPAASEHVILNGVEPTQAFTATLVDDSGHKKDVTEDISFYVESSFGEFAGPTLTIHAPGKSTVSAIYMDKQGSAQVLARVETVRVADDPNDPNDDVPPNAADLFNAATEDPAAAPTVVYPADGVTMPRNIGDFETHWTDARNNVFEVSLKSEFSSIKVYVSGNNGVPGAGPRPSWFGFTPTEWGYAAASENAVTYQVRGLDRNAPATVGSAPARMIRLTNQAMEGGLYYWAATAQGGGEYGLFRHDVSKPGQPAEPFMTDKSTGMCVACHALSRDGKTMAITYDGGDGRATIVDVATKTPQAVPSPLPAGQPDPFQTDTSRWNFATLYPDGSKMLTVFRGTISVRATTDQTALATMPSAGYATHPDLSADMTKLVYIRPAAVGSDWSFTGGTIFTRTYDPVAMSFGPETPLISTGDNNYYPSWSPDGNWIMFNRSATGDAYNNAQASLWVVKSDGSGQPIPLTAFNAVASGLTNSWGRWAPFQQTVGTNGEPIFWVTVSSKRDFGVRRMNSLQADTNANGTNEDEKTPQIWMAPFYTGRATMGQDPTAPAFRLPFQNLTSNNHIAQWTEKVVDVQ
jgi:hypothetical protein